MPARLGRYLVEPEDLGDQHHYLPRFGTDFSNPPFLNVPDLAQGVLVTPNASANVYGSYVSLVAANVLQRDWLITKWQAAIDETTAPPSGAQGFQYQLAAEDDEAFSTLRLIQAVRGTTATLRPTLARPVELPFPIFVPAGTPIRVRGAQSTTTATLSHFNLELTDPDLYPPETFVVNTVRKKGRRGYSFLPLDSAGVTVASAANAYGTFTQISAGLERDVYVVGVVCERLATAATNPTYVHGRLGLGANAAEIPVADIALPSAALTGSATISYTTPCATMFRVPTYVPSGTRLAFSLAGSTAVNYVVTLLVVDAVDVVPLEQVQ